LIDSLAKSDRLALLAKCRPVALLTADVIRSDESDASEVYFLTGASVALLVLNAKGVSTAAGLVKSEGAVGLQYALGFGPSIYQLLVQSSGSAQVVGGASLKRLMNLRPGILLNVSRYLWSSSQEHAQLAAAAQFQTVVQRLASWLLRSRDAPLDDFPVLTQTHLARMLGVRRSSVSVAAAELRRLGLIAYSRGRIELLNAPGLLLLSQQTMKP
jgi:CRP-like cAMP-binding protein